MTLALIIVLTAFLLIKYKNSAGWLLVYFISNPGGITGHFLSKGLLGGIFYIDIFFVVSFILILFGKYDIRKFFKNKIASDIFLILFIFALYKLFVWGLIVPDASKSEFIRYCLIRERDSIFGFLFIIPVYLFALKDLRTFLIVIVLFNLVILTLTILSITFGLDLIQISEYVRYRGSSIIRYLLSSYGLLSLLIPASIVIYAGKITTPYKWILIVGGILSVISIIISLTKGLYLEMMGAIMASLFLVNKVLKIQLTNSIKRVVFFSFLLILALSFVFPKYASYSLKAFTDIFTLAYRGETTEGESSRFWQIPAITYEIKRHPFFGTGQGYEQLSSEFDENQFDATDLPLLAHIMQYGLIGIILYLFYYFKVFMLFKRLYVNIRKFRRNDILRIFKYELIFLVVSISFFIGYFLRFYQVFIELTRGPDRILMSIYTGLLLACLERIRIKSIYFQSNMNEKRRTTE